MKEAIDEDAFFNIDPGVDVVVVIFVQHKVMDFACDLEIPKRGINFLFGIIYNEKRKESNGEGGLTS